MFAVNLDRWRESCNTFIDISHRICGPNKTEDLNLNVFNMITEINVSKKLTKHVSCKFKFNIDVGKCKIKSGIIPVWVEKCKRTSCVQKDYTWNPSTSRWNHSKHLSSITDNLVITCDEIIEPKKSVQAKSTSNKTVSTNFNKKVKKRKKRNCWFLLGFLLITIALLVAVSTYCYFIKYRAKKAFITISSHKKIKNIKNSIKNIL